MPRFANSGYKLDDEGNYLEGSINQRVVTRLESLTEKQRAFREPAEEAIESEDEARGAIEIARRRDSE